MGESVERLVELAGRIRVQGYTRESTLGNVVHVGAYWRSPAKMLDSEIADELRALASQSGGNIAQRVNRRNALLNEQRRRQTSGARRTEVLREQMSRHYDDLAARFRESPVNDRGLITRGTGAPPEVTRSDIATYKAQHNLRNVPDEVVAQEMTDRGITVLGYKDGAFLGGRLRNRLNAALNPAPAGDEGFVQRWRVGFNEYVNRVVPGPGTTRVTGVPATDEAYYQGGRDYARSTLADASLEDRQAILRQFYTDMGKYNVDSAQHKVYMGAVQETTAMIAEQQTTPENTEVTGLGDALQNLWDKIDPIRATKMRNDIFFNETEVEMEADRLRLADMNPRDMTQAELTRAIHDNVDYESVGSDPTPEQQARLAELLAENQRRWDFKNMRDPADIPSIPEMTDPELNRAIHDAADYASVGDNPTPEQRDRLAALMAERQLRNEPPSPEDTSVTGLGDTVENLRDEVEHLQQVRRNRRVRNMVYGRGFVTIQTNENGEWVTHDKDGPRYGNPEVARQSQRVSALAAGRESRLAVVRRDRLGRITVDPVPGTELRRVFGVQPLKASGGPGPGGVEMQYDGDLPTGVNQVQRVTTARTWDEDWTEPEPEPPRPANPFANVPDNVPPGYDSLTEAEKDRYYDLVDSGVSPALAVLRAKNPLKPTTFPRR